MLWETPIQKVLEEQGFIIINTEHKLNNGYVLKEFMCGQEDDLTYKCIGPVVIIGPATREEFDNQEATYNNFDETVVKPEPYHPYFRKIIAE